MFLEISIHFEIIISMFLPCIPYFFQLVHVSSSIFMYLFLSQFIFSFIERKKNYGSQEIRRLILGVCSRMTTHKKTKKEEIENTHTVTHTQSHSHTQSHTHSHTLTVTLTHTYTHSPTLTHSHTHIHPPTRIHTMPQAETPKALKFFSF